MLKYFRKRRPQHRVEALPVADAITASAWELSEAQWRSLSDFERRECRRLVTTAPRFQP